MKTLNSAESSATLGAACAIGAAAAFSTAGVILRRIDLPAGDIAFWRSILLFVTILPILAWRYPETVRSLRDGGSALLASAVALAASAIAFIVALDLAPVANVLIMFGATPFITAILARLMLGEPLHRHTVVAMTAAAAGIALSVIGSLRSGAAAGMTVALIVVMSMSANYVIVRRRRDIAMTPSLALAGLISALICLPFARPASLGLADLPWLLALGPGQLAIGLLLYMAALKRIPAGRAALLGLLELVLGPIWVWLFDGERPSQLTLLGGIIVIGAAAANVWLDSRRSSG